MPRAPRRVRVRAAIALVASLIVTGLVTDHLTTGAAATFRDDPRPTPVGGAERSKPKVTLKIPASVSDQSPVQTKVRLRWSRKLPEGVVVIRVDGKRAGQAAVAGGHKRGRVVITVGPLSLGGHRVSAVFKSHGRLLGKSKPTVVTSRAGCAPNPSACGYPDASNTGVKPGTQLRTIDGDVTITQDGTVFENAVVNGNLNIHAADVTVRNVRITTSGEMWGISLRHASNTTIENCEITPDSDRLVVGIKDIYDDSPNTVIRNCEIVRVCTGIQMGGGLIEDNYIHDLALREGDHLNGTTSNGSTTPLTIRHNTIFNQEAQTDAVSLFQDFGLEANRTITDNLLAGGGYTIYGGDGAFGATHDIVITGNRISRLFFPRGGYYGPVAHFDDSGAGNVWSGNVWDENSAEIRS